MTTRSGGITRRDFLKAGTGAAIAGIAGWPGSGGGAESRAASRIVLIRDPRAVQPDGTLSAEALGEMLDAAVATLFEKKNAADAWKSIIKPTDAVGIKTNVWAPLPTPSALEATIKRGLAAAGVAERDVGIGDRDVLGDSLFKRATALVNIRPMRTHHWAGLGTCLKNYIMFVPEPSDYHGNACEPLGAIWNLPHVKGKTRLNVLVMMTPLFHGIGPHHFSKSYTWPYAGLIIGTDPVAVDATGARIIQARRDAHFKKPSPISPPPRHIAAADIKYGLGNSDPARIEIVRIGSELDALI